MDQLRYKIICSHSTRNIQKIMITLAKKLFLKNGSSSSITYYIE